MVVENTQSPTLRQGNIFWFGLDKREKQTSTMLNFVVNIFRRQYEEYTLGLKIFNYKETSNFTKRFGFTQIETNIDINNTLIHKTFEKIHTFVSYIINALKKIFGYVKGVFIKKTDEKKDTPVKQSERKPDETIKAKAVTKGTPFWFGKLFVTKERYRLGRFSRIDVLKQRYKEYFLGLNIFNKYKTTIEERMFRFVHVKSVVQVENGIIHRTLDLMQSTFSFTFENLGLVFQYLKTPFIKKEKTDSIS